MRVKGTVWRSPSVAWLRAASAKCGQSQGPPLLAGRSGVIGFVVRVLGRAQPAEQVGCDPVEGLLRVGAHPLEKPARADCARFGLALRAAPGNRG